ncbi:MULTISPECIES: polysaccharide pyruvyl transferase family protein [Fictibacillus]|uniref:Polysaccharide pyruvyl transferase n=1 Tax=Fictibacillus enclensis TaxID=1017270 RepID=A0A0V8JA38_9BACL|nr:MULTISPECIES: polysaccharide pyruvyl transferase family protein [Fictibacillus]KSU83891.1 polysaccharide pyruvyl transferase [Fictibacillus enclensis]RXZ02771.1 polysaccharide pyruvyl transferase family protein [Fictibacillus sp. S7]
MAPYDNYEPTQIIVNNSIGGNVGNLVYQYSVFRTLMTEGTTITPDHYDFNPKYADEINEKYDAYIIPLADAFREDFVPSLRKYTKLIKKLKIPVVVIGVGLRAPFEPKLNEGFSFDEDVKAFVSAVLEKSSILGLRGQITSDYLSRLGFREGTDHTVIGCPSMYAYGRELKIRETNITPNSMVSVNSSRLSPKNVLDFIDRSMNQFPNHYFIPQWMKEMVMTYVGAPSVSNAKDSYPNRMSHPLYLEDRVRYPLNATGWFDFLKQADLSFGARLHGNIAAVLAGTPSILIPKDARMRELAEYHNLTHIMANEITDQTNIMDLVETLDFQSVTKNQGKNFDHYIDFLNKNNLDHIYKETLTPSSVPLDDKMDQSKVRPPIGTITGCTKEEMVQRWESYYPKVNAKEEAKAEQTKKKLNAKISEKDKIIKKQRGTLNRKSVKLALKVADIVK